MAFCLLDIGTVKSMGFISLRFLKLFVLISESLHEMKNGEILSQFLVFGHYPTSLVSLEEPGLDLREILGRPRGEKGRRPAAYLCGHLHTLFRFVFRLDFSFFYGNVA